MRKQIDNILFILTGISFFILSVTKNYYVFIFMNIFLLARALYFVWMGSIILFKKNNYISGYAKVGFLKLLIGILVISCLLAVYFLRRDSLAS